MRISCPSRKTKRDALYTRTDESLSSSGGNELRKWLAKLGTKTLYIELGSPWENGYCESFNGKLRDGFVNGKIFYSLKEAQILTERWRVEYNMERPHSALGYRPPALQSILPKKLGHGDVENKTRFPHLHTPDDDGQSWNKALHQHSTWYKRSVRSEEYSMFLYGAPLRDRFEVARQGPLARPFSDQIDCPLDTQQEQSDQHNQRCGGGDHKESSDCYILRLRPV